MKLIITEKKSFAEELAKGFESYTSQNGYFETPEYTITYARGHLYGVDTEKLTEKKPWKMEYLPILPQKFEYLPNPSTLSQLKVIQKLLKSASSVVISTDAGREGELIARLILNESGWKNWNNTFRLWTSEALTKEVVMRCLKTLEPAAKFDSVYYAALSRQHCDWTIGINLTRAVTSIFGTEGTGSDGKWSVGRVQTPLLRLIVERDLLRANFKSEQYFILKSSFSFNNINYEGYYFKDKESIPDTTEEDEEIEIGNKLNKLAAENILKDLFNINSGKVVSVNKLKKEEAPPLLHSLSELQKEANRIFGFSLDKTLEIAQALYETHKCLSYPRTSSKHLSESSKNLVSELLKKFNKSSLIPNVSTVGKRVFDDSKLSDHYAMIPLEIAPENLNKEEKCIYDLVYRRFIGAFMPIYEYETTTLITEVKGHLFKTNGKITNKAGWKSLYKSEIPDVLPDIKVNDEVLKLKVDVIEKKTKPPLAITGASLISLMDKYNLGTEATRAGIVLELEKSNYIIKEKNSLISTIKGRNLINNIKDRSFADPKYTGEFELKLNELIAKNKGIDGYKDFMKDINVYLQEEINSAKTLKIVTVKQDLGKCGCGKEIKEMRYNWYCECGKKVNKEIFHKNVTLKQAQELMNGKVVQFKGLKGKEKKFDTGLKLKSDNTFDFIFNKK